jgi:hypothetical protein
MSTAIAVIGALLAVVLIVWFVAQRKHPEDASGHLGPDRTGTALMHGDTHDRPAGPGAEDEFVSGDGRIGPGPSAESLPEATDPTL